MYIKIVFESELFLDIERLTSPEQLSENQKELVKKYNLSPKTMREIVAKKIQNH